MTLRARGIGGPARYTGPRVLSGPRDAKPDPATCLGSSYLWASGTDIGDLMWVATLVDDAPKWLLAQVFNFAATYTGLTDLEPADADEVLLSGVFTVTTAQATTYTWSGSAWTYIAPTHGPWVGAETSPDFGLPEYGDEGLQDGDIGVSNTSDTPIWWRFSAAAREWYRVAEIGQTSNPESIRASWFDVDSLPVVAGSPVTAQGWDSFTADSCTVAGGYVRIEETGTGGLYAPTGTVPTSGKLALVIRDAHTAYSAGCTGQTRAWSGALTTASSSRLASLQRNPSWSPDVWHIGGASNSSITGSLPNTPTTIEVYITAAGVCRIYLDRASTPAATYTGLVLGSSSETRRAAITLSSITGGTASFRCAKYAAIGFE